MKYTWNIRTFGEKEYLHTSAIDAHKQIRIDIRK